MRKPSCIPRDRSEARPVDALLEQIITAASRARGCVTGDLYAGLDSEARDAWIWHREIIKAAVAGIDEALKMPPTAPDGGEERKRER